MEETARGIARQGKELLGVDLDPAVLARFITGEVGRHGETYPDMAWEPKGSFKAVADYYRAER